MKYPVLQLNPGREANVGFHHPWVFSGALHNAPEHVAHGALVHVADRNGRVIGTGTYSKKGMIAVRLFAFSDIEIDQLWITQRIKEANEQRLLLGYGPKTPTTGYRVVFGEVDNLPGLVIDRYGDVLVLQFSTAGMEFLKPLVLAACQTLFSPQAIVERGDMSARQAEGLEGIDCVHLGEVTNLVEFKEHGVSILADVMSGQKTGYFLDQRDLRQQVAKLANGKKILNLFSYTGGTSVMALKNGAASVHNVDSSAPALEICQKIIVKNNIDPAKSTVEELDVFAWLDDHREGDYDMVILDPPALTKSAKDVESAAKAYHFLNRAAMRLVKNGGILVTSSCSRFFMEDDFTFVLRRASVQTGVRLDVLALVDQAADHPRSVYFPESHYLKSFICSVRR